MIYIIEGAKYTGKTTLCENLKNLYSGTIIHFPTNSEYGNIAKNMLNKNLSDEEYEKCQDYMLQDIEFVINNIDLSKTWIFDRSFISNYVYRKKNIDYAFFENKFSKFIQKAIIIILICDIETLIERIKIRAKGITPLELSLLEYSNNKFIHLAEKASPIKNVCECVAGQYYYIKND